jgi:hypothetical protein
MANDLTEIAAALEADQSKDFMIHVEDASTHSQLVRLEYHLTD